MRWLYKTQNFEIIRKYYTQVNDMAPRYFLCVYGEEIETSEEHYEAASVGDTLEVITELSIKMAAKKCSKKINHITTNEEVLR